MGEMAFSRLLANLANSELEATTYARLASTFIDKDTRLASEKIKKSPLRLYYSRVKPSLTKETGSRGLYINEISTKDNSVPD